MKICQNCGTSNSQGSGFCKGCGTRLIVEPNPYIPNHNYGYNQDFAPKKKGSLLPFIFISLFLVAIGVLGYRVLPQIFNSRTFIDVVQGDGEIRFVSDGKLLEHKINGNFEEFAGTLNGKALAILTYDEELYIVDSKGAERVSREVYTFRIANTSRAVVYEDNNDNLYLYDIKGNRHKITSNASYSFFAISPDGKTVVYDEIRDGEYRLFLYEKGESKQLYRGFRPIAVSNSARHIYAIKEGTTDLWMLDTKDNRDRLAMDYYWADFNIDNTEICFANDRGTFVSVKGSDPVRIYDSEAWVIGDHIHSNYFTDIDAYFTSVKSFQDYPMHDSDNRRLMYLDNKQETHRIASNIFYYQITYDEKKIYFIIDSKLYESDIKANPYGTQIFDADRVEKIVINKTGAIIYYVDDEDTLYSIKGNDKRQRLAYDVKELYVDDKGNAIFIEDYDWAKGYGTLSISTNGKDKTKIDDGVFKISNGRSTSWSSYRNVFYRKADGYIYMINGKNKGIRITKY